MACSGACMQEATAHLLQHRRQQLHEQCVLLVGRRGLLLLLLVLLLRLLLRRRELLADLQARKARRQVTGALDRVAAAQAGDVGRQLLRHRNMKLMSARKSETMQVAGATLEMMVARWRKNLRSVDPCAGTRCGAVLTEMMLTTTCQDSCAPSRG